MNGKTLKWVIYIWGAICFFIFLSVRFEPVFNSLLKEPVVENYWDRTTYGEMYYFSMIRHFREEGLPPAHDKFEYSEKQASPADAEILTFGDSFFEFSRLKQFSERLADDYQKKVHYVNDDFPLRYLAQHAYEDTRPKLIIYERTERYIPVSFKEEQELKPQVPSYLKKSVAGKIKDKIFYSSSEELYDVMLKRSYVSAGLYSFFTTLRFDLFGQITSLTPKYSRNGSDNWLFYHDQVNDDVTSFYYEHSKADIDRICDNMADLARKLKDEYNLYLVYLPVPAKYTLYHGIINDDPYNNFLPDLYKGLDERGVRYINIYDDFRTSKDTLYYRTDSHWKQNGLDMAYDRTMAYCRGDSILNDLLK